MGIGHRCGQRTRRQARLHLESLDDRLVLSAAAGAAVSEAVGGRTALIEHRQEVRALRQEARHLRHQSRHSMPAATHNGSAPTATSSGPSTGATGSLPANMAASLQALYQEYQSKYDGGDSDDFTLPGDRLLVISGDRVGVVLKMGSSGDFDTFLSQLQADGLQVSSSSSTYGLVTGMLPISEMPAVAQVAASVTPMTRPVLD